MNTIRKPERLIQQSTKIIPIGEFIGFPDSQVFAADERGNLGGSHKDRPAGHMLYDAVVSGALKPGMVAVDYSTGSEAISVVRKCQIIGVKAHIVMPENITIERERMIRAAGGELTLTSADRELADDEKDLSDHLIWVRGAVAKAKQICEERSDHYLLNQSVNRANPRAFHSLATDFIAHMGDVDYVVAASGTGATIIGMGEVFKSAGLITKIVAVNVEKSPDLWALKKGVSFEHHPHKLFGTGPGASSPITQKGHNFIDSVARVNDDECYEVARELGVKGLEVGPSTAANVIVIRDILRRRPKARIATVIFDHADRYRSVGL